MFGIVPCRIGGHGILRGFAQRCVLFFFSFSLNLFLSIVITNSDLISILRTIIRFVNQRISLQHYVTLSSSPHKNWKFQLRSWIPPGFSLHLPSRVCLQLDNFSKHMDQRRGGKWSKKGSLSRKLYKFWICLGAPCRGKRRTSIGSSDIIFGRWSRANFE